MDCNSGSEKATVFPEPVFACPITSLPFISGPIAFSWIGDGLVNPMPSMPLSIEGASSIASNVLIVFFASTGKSSSENQNRKRSESSNLGLPVRNHAADCVFNSDAVVLFHRGTRRKGTASQCCISTVLGSGLAKCLHLARCLSLLTRMSFPLRIHTSLSSL